MIDVPTARAVEAHCRSSVCVGDHVWLPPAGDDAPVRVMVIALPFMRDRCGRRADAVLCSNDFAALASSVYADNEAGRTLLEMNIRNYLFHHEGELSRWKECLLALRG